MGEDTRDKAAWAGPSYLGMELFCARRDGWVEVVDSENRPVARLSLAAAEDLATMLGHHAAQGRIAAAPREATASPEKEVSDG